MGYDSEKKLITLLMKMDADIVVMTASLPICEKLEGVIRKLFPETF